MLQNGAEVPETSDKGVRRVYQYDQVNPDAYTANRNDYFWRTWGAGIVCGFNVTVQGLCVKVHPGFALDCEGNAIESCGVITIDLIDVCRGSEHGAANESRDAISAADVERALRQRRTLGPSGT